jgi:small multidrug resistance family-3 protein
LRGLVSLGVCAESAEGQFSLTSGGYGVAPTYQPAHFGRVYAAYGGWFVVLSLAWGWALDRTPPDRYDLIGGLICLVGVAIIMYSPR